uniref:Crumbs homolog 3b n=1 Tax=Periophthalmus magnuspinnatus TaxID=409849 RepID=A0A3B4A178_9GOBI
MNHYKCIQHSSSGCLLNFRCAQADAFPVPLCPSLSAIVAPTVTLGVLAIVLGVVGWLFCVLKKKRQTEGTYRPSAEEQSGAKGVVAPDTLKLPKEERLI